MSEAWMETHSGLKWSPFDVNLISNWKLDDLVQGTSRLCRYAGQLRDNIDLYSVLEHSVLIFEALDRDLPEPETDTQLFERLSICRSALAHDLTEGLMVDLPRPLKSQINKYGHAEHWFWRNIADRLLLPRNVPLVVRQYDGRIVVDERAQALNPSSNQWSSDDLQPLGVQLQFWTPRQAREAWMAHWEQLTAIFGEIA